MNVVDFQTIEKSLISAFGVSAPSIYQKPVLCQRPDNGRQTMNRLRLYRRQLNRNYITTGHREQLITRVSWNTANLSAINTFQKNICCFIPLKISKWRNDCLISKWNNTSFKNTNCNQQIQSPCRRKTISREPMDSERLTKCSKSAFFVSFEVQHRPHRL